MGSSTSSLKARSGLIVTLDVLGTIYKFKEPLAVQYLNVAKRAGLQADIDTNDLNKAFKSSFTSLKAKYPNYGKGQLANPGEWWNNLVHNAFSQVAPTSAIPPSLGKELYDHFSSSTAYELYPDVESFFATMRYLKDQFRSPEDPLILVGVITNSDPRVKGVLESLSLKVGIDHNPTLKEVMDREFKKDAPTSKAMVARSPWYSIYGHSNDIDFVATSYERGSEKPDARIFLHAVQLTMMNDMSRTEQSIDVDKFSVAGLLMQRIGLIASEQATFKPSFIHVGDEYKKDYLGAKKMGWGGLHLQRETPLHDLEFGREAEVVTDLHQVAAIVSLMAQQNFRKADGALSS